MYVDTEQAQGLWWGNLIGLLVGSSIFLIVLATQAASRLTMNSKPSLEIRVTNGEGVFDMVDGECRTCQ